VTRGVRRNSCALSRLPSAQLHWHPLLPVAKSVILAEVRCRELPTSVCAQDNDSFAGVFAMSFDDGDATGSSSRGTASANGSSMSKSDPFFSLIYGRDVRSSASWWRH
jgi:hypothetical protein